MAELTSANLLNLSFVSDPRVAPGGRRVAAVITKVVTAHGEAPRYRSQIELFDLTDDTSRTLETAYSDSKPRFSPDGRLLAFLRKTGKDEPAQLHLLDLEEGGSRQLTEEAGGVEAFDWHPSSASLAYLSPARAKEEGSPVKREIERIRYRSDGKGYLPAEARRLRLLTTEGQVRDLDARGLDFEELAWSVDGSELILSGARDQIERDEELRRLWLLDPNGGTPRELTPAMRLQAPVPGPAGIIAFLAPAKAGQPAGPSTVWLVSREGGDERPLTGEDNELAPTTGGDSRYGDYPNAPSWLKQDQLLVNHNVRGRSGLATLPVDGGALEPLTEEKSVVTAFGRAESTTAFVRETSAAPGELFIREGDEPARQLTSFNVELASRFGFVAANGPFTPGEDGAQYWRLDPTHPRDDRAIVVQVHGGPHTNVGEGFYFEFQLLAALGYTVIYGNPRGSSSFGQEFATTILGRYGTVDADDVLSFVDHALQAHPHSDAPVHLTGGSYGGFMTNWLVAHTDRFRSAVTQRSICNFLSFYGTSDIGFHFSERELQGDPWERHARLWQQSPLRLAHRVTTPLLILHSESDLRCPVEQAQQLFVAIKRNGRADTKLVLFPEENHELSRSGRPDRRIARLDAITGWFEAHA